MKIDTNLMKDGGGYNVCVETCGVRGEESCSRREGRCKGGVFEVKGATEV